MSKTNVAVAPWFETEQSKMTKRDYRYISHARHDMKRAQENGWKVEEVKVDGMTITEIAKSSWWLEAWGPQLFLKPDNSVDLRIWPRSRGSRWNWLGLVASIVSLPFGPRPEAPFNKIEIVFVHQSP